MGRLKYRKYPWPSDGATRKFVDRVEDKLNRKFDSLRQSISRIMVRLVELEQRTERVEMEVLGQEEE